MTAEQMHKLIERADTDKVKHAPEPLRSGSKFGGG